MKKGKAPGEYVWERDGSVMVRFPGGKYYLGHKTFRNARWVELEEFYIDKYEVSKERYRAFLKAKRKDRDPGRWEHPKAREGGASRFGGKWSDTPDGGPVINVSWYKAWSFARWMGKSLPTAEEWEAAASWDTTAGKRGSFPWGKGFQMEWANTNELWAAKGKAEGKPKPCGSFPKDRSPCGCMDMAGNVKEWCLYDALPPVTHFLPRTETPDGRMKVHRFMEESSFYWRPVRGGCYAHPYTMAQAQMCEMGITDSGRRWTGFRCIYRPEGWKTFARLARDAGSAGRPKEAAMLIGELKIAQYAIDAVVGAFRGWFEHVRTGGEKAEAEGKFAEALDLYLLALQVVPDTGRENEMNGRVRRVRQWWSVLKAADAALEGRSRSALEKALADLGKVIGTFPDTKAASMARERILRAKERLASLPSGDGEDKPRGLDEILEMLASKDSSRRRMGRYALSNWDENPKESVLILIQAFQDRSRFGSFARYSLLQSIARLGAAAGDEQAVQAADVLVKALRDQDPQMRSYARFGIGALGPHGAPGVEALLSILAREQRLPMEIAQSLGEIGPKAKAALPVLRAHLEKRKPEAGVEDPFLDAAVLIAFRRIATRKDVEDSIPLLRFRDSPARPAGSCPSFRKRSAAGTKKSVPQQSWASRNSGKGPSPRSRPW
jgi:formylglycine-generating enzyme required for sulfatase activity